MADEKKFGDSITIKGLGAASVNAVFPDGSFTVTAADGSVQGPYTDADVETAAPQAP